jgi:hypothetical protein
MDLVLFAFESGMTERIVAIASKCLAVGGGFLLGYCLGIVVVWGLDRWLFARKTPDVVKRVCKNLLGLIVAILVALVVFGEGGNSLFGGGGGDGKGTPGSVDSKDAGKPVTSTEPKVTPPTPVPKQPDARDIDSVFVIPVTIYGGTRVTEDRYYQLGTDSTLQTLAETQAAILSRVGGQERGKTAIEIGYPADPTIASGNRRVITNLTDWAKKEGFRVIEPVNP